MEVASLRSRLLDRQVDRYHSNGIGPFTNGEVARLNDQVNVYNRRAQGNFQCGWMDLDNFTDKSRWSIVLRDDQKTAETSPPSGLPKKVVSLRDWA